ncbi:MAG: MFS transporter, partial [Deltaproteobacteria bacterium]|nr:MFS transporter [Deltaproteobacteria bacterium]
MESPPQSSSLVFRNKSLLAWVTYDWAFSAFSTSITAALLPAYFAKVVAPAEVVINLAGFTWRTQAGSLWGYAASLSLLLIALSSPWLGALADQTNNKKAFLLGFAYLGALTTPFLYWAKEGAVGLTLF